MGRLLESITACLKSDIDRTHIDIIGCLTDKKIVLIVNSLIPICCKFECEGGGGGEGLMHRHTKLVMYTTVIMIVT